MKIFHTADWHFREKDYDEIEKCVAFILGCALREKPDLICISGDLTDSRLLNLDSRSARSILKIIQSMLMIAPVAIVIGTPSHDGKASLALRSCRGRYPIIVSDMPEQVGYYVGTEDTLSIGRWHKHGEGFTDPEFILTQLPQPTKQYFVSGLSIEDNEKAIGKAMGNMIAAFGQISLESFDHVPHIVNGHGQIGGAYISETQQLIGYDIEVSKSQLESLNADLICYGHIHKAQNMGGNIFYSGSPTRMNFGETEDKGFWIHEVDFPNSTHKTSQFIQTPAREMVNIKSDYTDKSENMALKEYIESMDSMAFYLYDSCHVKFELRGWQDDLVNISQDKIKSKFYKAGADHVVVNLIRVPRETVRAERVLKADTLPDKIEAMAELRGDDIAGSILEKATALETGEQQPWIQDLKNKGESAK